MSNTVLVSLILVGILTLARLWIGVQLFLTARKSHLINLYWLAASFVLALYNIFAPQLKDSPLANPWIFTVGFIAGHICLAMFIHTTFYRGRQSPVAFIIFLFVIALAISLYFTSINEINLATVVSGVVLVNWIWHLIVAQDAYSTIANDASVEKWVKERYKLMMVYIVLFILSSVLTVLNSTSLSVFIPPALVPASILLVIASIILQFLVWVMPEPFRLWLNRTQPVRPVVEEQQSVSALDIFGTAMTAGTGLNRIACFYAIRSAIGKQIGTDNSDAIRDYIQTMTYHEWEGILQNPEIRRILVNGGADKVSAGQAIDNAQQALVEKQSLLTFSVR